jgi:hypothetical protein
MRLTIVAATLACCTFTIAPAGAQKPSPEDPHTQTERVPQSLIGELVSVDTAARTFAIKTASEGEVKFSYTDKTEIVGTEKFESALAGTPGAEVRVQYDTHGTARVATRIEVRPRK